MSLVTELQTIQEQLDDLFPQYGTHPSEQLAERILDLIEKRQSILGLNSPAAQYNAKPEPN